MINRIGIFLLVVYLGLVLVGCNNSDESPNSSIRKKNQKGEFIYRRHDEFFFTPPAAAYKSPPEYPWNKSEQKSGS